MKKNTKNNLSLLRMNRSFFTNIRMIKRCRIYRYSWTNFDLEHIHRWQIPAKWANPFLTLKLLSGLWCLNMSFFFCENISKKVNNYSFMASKEALRAVQVLTVKLSLSWSSSLDKTVTSDSSSTGGFGLPLM